SLRLARSRQSTNSPCLLTASCLLATADCPLLTAHCLLLNAVCFLPVPRRLDRDVTQRAEDVGQGRDDRLAGGNGNAAALQPSGAGAPLLEVGRFGVERHAERTAHRLHASDLRPLF